MSRYFIFFLNQAYGFYYECGCVQDLFYQIGVPAYKSFRERLHEAAIYSLFNSIYLTVMLTLSLKAHAHSLLPHGSEELPHGQPDVHHAAGEL